MHDNITELDISLVIPVIKPNLVTSKCYIVIRFQQVKCKWKSIVLHLQDIQVLYQKVLTLLQVLLSLEIWLPPEITQSDLKRLSCFIFLNRYDFYFINVFKFRIHVPSFLYLDIFFEKQTDEVI